MDDNNIDKNNKLSQLKIKIDIMGAEASVLVLQLLLDPKRKPDIKKSFLTIQSTWQKTIKEIDDILEEQTL